MKGCFFNFYFLVYIYFLYKVNAVDYSIIRLFFIEIPLPTIGGNFFYWKISWNEYTQIEILPLLLKMTHQEDFMREAIALSAKNIREKN